MQVGVDISKLMLEKLREKIDAQGLKGIEVMEGDAETIEFPSESFDWILCSSAFIWMSDLAGALSRWRSFLARGGNVAFHAFPEEAFVTGEDTVVAKLCLIRHMQHTHSVEQTSLIPCQELC